MPVVGGVGRDGGNGRNRGSHGFPPHPEAGENGMVPVMIPGIPEILTVGVHKEVRTRAREVGEGEGTALGMALDEMMIIGGIEEVVTRARVDRGESGMEVAMSHVDTMRVGVHKGARRMRGRDEGTRALDAGRKTRRG